MNSLAAAVVLAFSLGDARAWVPSHHRPSLHLPTSSSSHISSSRHPSHRIEDRRDRRHKERTHKPQRLVHATRFYTALQSSTGITTIEHEQIASILSNLDEASLPLLHIGPRIGSGTYGTVHNGYLIRSKTDIQPCVAKRSWTFPELKAGVPAQVGKLSEKAVAVKTGLASARPIPETNKIESSSPSEEEGKRLAERCKHYWEVERHCFQKMEKNKSQGKNNGEIVSLEKAIPSFLGVYKDDGSGSDMSELIAGYGLIEEQREGNSIGGWFSSNGDTGKGDESNSGHEWMVFECVKSLKSSESPTAENPDNICALTLLDAMEMDWIGRNDRRRNARNHLYGIQKAMGLPESYEFGDVLDKIFQSLLENLSAIHSANIVHRDLKPGNLLCDSQNQRLRLIDFGSAADLDPSPASLSASNIFSGGKVRVGLDEGIVALSPVYAAPETFVKVDANPTSFDVFSAALIMCQLLFKLLDERTDAGFHQQLKDVEYNLDSWLEIELAATLRPAGLDDALEYLGERRGLWRILKRMLQPDPTQRISSTEALEQFDEVMGLKDGRIEWLDPIIIKVAKDEAFFETVIDSFERCDVNYNDFDGNGELREMPRPLHFLASFKSNNPIGLILAEASPSEENDGSLSEEDWTRWKSATKNTFPGEVFVKGWTDGGQADSLGIFEIGDRLRGVGELPFVDGGFEGAIKLIERQPKTGGTIKLHFDRLPSIRKAPIVTMLDDSKCAKVTGQGAWKSKGRRNSQEDNFILHEVRNRGVGDVLLCGVFDGHGGTAASESVSKVLPPLFSEELEQSSAEGQDAIKLALEKSWETTCETYRSLCENGECVVDYDSREGILFAETGSKDLIAGTTATIAAISLNPSGARELTVLNCGDSRTILVGELSAQSNEKSDNSVVVFETRDHSPDDELEIQRLQRGKEAGLDYSVPECSMSQSYLRVGDFQYALCRSLEGSYVTSKGIVSDPDITTLQLSQILDERHHCALVLSCDGLFEVMSNEEVGLEVVRMRKEGYKAGETAKNLCGQALKKGSYDNISTIVVYLDSA